MKVIELFEETHRFSKIVTAFPGDIAEILNKECSVAVEACRKSHKLLMRGIRDATSPFSFGQALIRQNRMPLFMDKPYHDLINDAMIHLKLKAHRGNSIFCTTRPGIASEWGRIYAVFPVDGWAGTVFQDITQTYAFDYLYPLALRIYKDKSMSDEEKFQALVDALKEFKPHSFSTAEELSIVLDKKYADILITGKKYYGVKLTTNGTPTEFTNDVFEKLGI